MLLIGDLHITSKIQDRLLEAVKAFVANHNEEKNLIFLGDFVYHFSYDRKALGALFDLFLQWYKEGKQLYILAGNHDWMGQFFVFDEGRKTFELFQSGIKFITKPLLETIDGEQVLFLPHMLEIHLEDYPGIEEFQDEQYQQMIKTNHKNLIFSAKLNLLLSYFQAQQAGTLTVIHHYYFDGVAFPGQKSKFSFKDLALDQKWLNHPRLKLISGHLHQAFCYQNYLCTGSTWATSPLEENQLKAFWKWNNDGVFCYETGVNAYLSLDFDARKGSLRNEDVQAFHSVLEDKFKMNCQKVAGIPVMFEPHSSFDLKYTTLFLRVPELHYTQMDQFATPELQNSLSDLRLKKQHIPVEDLLGQLQAADKGNLQGSFTAWVELLKNLLRKKYPQDYDEYESLLQELHLL